VYGDSAGTERIFPFDLIPRIVPADPRLAAPISGLYRGAARSEMQFTISMEVEESR
jgi:hypothetical protein